MSGIIAIFAGAFALIHIVPSLVSGFGASRSLSAQRLQANATRKLAIIMAAEQQSSLD